MMAEVPLEGGTYSLCASCFSHFIVSPRSHVKGHVPPGVRLFGARTFAEGRATDVDSMSNIVPGGNPNHK